MNAGLSSHELLPKAILLAIIGVCLPLSGCEHAITTWSGEARSPDGRWVATARSERWAGPGTAYDATTVYLKWTDGGKAPMQVLAFSHQFPTMNLKMEWMTPNHLDVTYGESARPGDHVHVDFQVVRYGNVDISLRDLSTQTGSASR
jgi:hypothetical protein